MKFKKAISGILIVCLMVLFASCDAASILRMGELMGKTESNVFGVKPNMADVEEVAGDVSASVTKDDAGQIKVDFAKAAKIQDKVAEIGNSPTKKDELRKEMKKPVAATDDDSAKVKAELDSKKSGVVNDAKTQIDRISDENVKKALEKVVENIGAIKVSDKPTQAELVSVAVVSDLATTLTTEVQKAADNSESLDADKLLEVYNKAIDAVETIKTVNDNELDLLQGVDIAGLMDLIGGGAKGLGDLDEPYKGMAESAITAMLDAIDHDKDGEITKNEFGSFAGYLSYVRAAYETGGFAFRPIAPDPDHKYGFEGIDEWIDKPLDKRDFTINDVQLYLLSALFTEGEKFFAAADDGGLSGLIVGKPKKAQEAADRFLAIFEAHDFKLKTVLARYVGVDPDGGDGEMEKGLEILGKKIANILNTAIVIAYKADYAKTLKSAATGDDERFDEVLNGLFQNLKDLIDSSGDGD